MTRGKLTFWYLVVVSAIYFAIGICILFVIPFKTSVDKNMALYFSQMGYVFFLLCWLLKLHLFIEIPPKELYAEA